ncbi:hypothetical protein MTO96_005180 [Rhipicephalus appendiculatus]
MELLLTDLLGASHDHEDSTRPFLLLTPAEAGRRGSQLSLRLAAHYDARHVLQELLRRGIVGDLLPPSVLRFTPIPLYSTFEDAYNCVQALKEICDRFTTEGASYTNGH